MGFSSCNLINQRVITLINNEVIVLKRVFFFFLFGISLLFISCDSGLTSPDKILVTGLELRSMILNGEDVTNVDTSGIINMSGLFQYESTFNQDISGWDVSSVTDMSYMFGEAIAFNQDISTWDVSNVTNMELIFGVATAFNQDISLWDVSSVTNMNLMFYCATTFNQDISSWDVSRVTKMYGLFGGASAFNQNISSWSDHILESVDHDSFSSGNCPLFKENHPYASWDN